MNRRSYLKRAVFSLLLLPYVKAIGRETEYSIKTCSTGEDTAGPFHRKNAPFRTKLHHNYKGTGKVLNVSGHIFDSDCETALPNVIVDIWHASPKGEYDNDSTLYQFRGQIKTNKNGFYHFETLLPAPYTDAGLDRPKHIHYKVRAKGYAELTTQLYFEGDDRLVDDFFVKKNDGMKRVRPIVEKGGVSEVVFDIYLTK